MESDRPCAELVVDALTNGSGARARLLERAAVARATKSGELESQDLLLRRIEEAAKYVAIEDLALSPQCGFASTIAGNPLTVDEQRRKLELVVDTARRVWG